MEQIKLLFAIDNPNGKLFARYATLLLWIIGSLYMMNMEHSKTNRDWLVIWTTPIVWALVIAIPVIGFNAWKERNRAIALFLFFCAFVGSIYTLSSTISRQSQYRDSNVVSSQQDSKTRKELDRRLLLNHNMLDEEMALKRKKCDNNPNFDCYQIESSIKVYMDAVEGVKRDMEKLGKIQTPTAGEERFADILVMFGYNEFEAKKTVVLFLPMFFGFFLELSALATAMYGFHNMGLVYYRIQALNDVQKIRDKLAFYQHQLQLQHDPVERRVIQNNINIAERQLNGILK